MRIIIVILIVTYVLLWGGVISFESRLILIFIIEERVVRIYI